jgi:ADP-ribosylglycohydrolase
MKEENGDRVQRAKVSLLGLSVGDAFGERFFGPRAKERIAARELKSGPWRWTDDTAMSISLLETLLAHGTVDQKDFSQRLARRYAKEPDRGYGAGAHGLLHNLGLGVPWKQAASSLFGGTGSFGNGAAMRIAPLGALFSNDLNRVAAEAVKSAEVTHAHPQGVAGAVAIAVAAAMAQRGDLGRVGIFFDAVLSLTPAGATRDGIEEVARLPITTSPEEVAARVGSGQQVSAQDTVPFALFCAAAYCNSYEEALWGTVAGLGDRDTTCAMVGGIVILHAPPKSVPGEFIENTETVPVQVRADALHPNEEG